DLVYNSNDQQEITGGLPSPTQYFPLGKRWSFSYASFYREQSPDVITLIMPDGARETYTFSGNTSVPAHADNYYVFERYSVIGGYGYGLTMKETKLKYRYDNPYHHKLTSIEDRNGNTVELNYDLNYNLHSITDANGRSVTFNLNGNGRITQATDPLGRTALFQYGYTNNEFLVGITDMGGFASTIAYDQVQIANQSGYTWQPQIVSITTPAGTTEIAWTATGIIGPNQLAFYWTFTNPNGVSSTTYFSYGAGTTGIIKSYDNNGNFDTYYVDLPNYRITHIVRPDPSASIFYGYDAAGNVNSITTGYFEKQYVWDESGNITQFSDPRFKATLFSYDDNDNLETITDPMNRTITFEYDGNDNVIGITTPVSEEQFTYYPDGNLQTYTNGNNNQISYNYDGFGYLSEIIYPSGNPTSLINDDLGRILSLTDLGWTTEYLYDDLNQITRVTYPDATLDQYGYDFQNLVETIDRGSRSVEFTYDGMNQVVSAKGPHGYLTLECDGNGNMTRLSMNALSTSYSYDGLNRLIVETNPDGTSKQYAYNEIGNILTRLDENGLLTTYSYDFDLLTHIDYAGNTPDVSYSHNDNGEIIQMNDGIGTTTYNYDVGGRLVTITGPGQGDDFTYTYDSAFNNKTMDVDGLAIEYSYDDLNRLSNVESNYTSAAYSYDANSNLIRKTLGNDSYTDYTYDGLNRLSSLYNKKSTGEMISGFDYSFDASTMLQKIEDHRGITSNYEYDYMYRLVSEQVIDQEAKTLWHNKFSYDNMGNRISIHKNGVLDQYTYNVSNQLTSLTKTTINVSGIVDGDSASTIYVEDIKAKTSYLGDNQLAFEAFDIPVEQNCDTLQVYARVNEVLATVGDSSKFICTSGTLPNGNINIYLFTDIENVEPENIN
nr:RHS repeat protein [Bacteroidota bacterium]